MEQNTVKNPVSFGGIGLHSAVNVNIKILPAKEDTGILLKRVDVKEYDNEIQATYSSVVNTQLGTTIANKFGVTVQTIEHLMAALWACNIDNTIIEIDNQEIPIMDGSSDLFIKEIKKVGTVELGARRRYLKILKKVETKKGDSRIIFSPSKSYKIEMDIFFPYGNIGKQTIIFDGTPEFFTHEIAKARTFCNEKEIEFMKQNGLARGGSLDNAMVFNDKEMLNPGGFRCDNEVVKHKLLDCVGDMFTCGYYIKGEITASLPGHTINNEALKNLFSDKTNYTIE